MEDKPVEMTEKNSEIDRILYELFSATSAMDITKRSATFWHIGENTSPQLADAKRIIKQTILDRCLGCETFCKIKILDCFSKDIVNWLRTSGYIIIRMAGDNIDKLPAHWYTVSWEQTDF